MQVQITFRVNAETGEIEYFQVDDVGRTRQIRDHDALHEDIAQAIAEVIDPRADVSEVIGPSRRATTGPQIPVQPIGQGRAEELEQGGSA
jgi:hypothetical protein